VGERARGCHVEEEKLITQNSPVSCKRSAFRKGRRLLLSLSRARALTLSLARLPPLVAPTDILSRVLSPPSPNPLLVQHPSFQPAPCGTGREFAFFCRNTMLRTDVASSVRVLSQCASDARQYHVLYCEYHKIYSRITSPTLMLSSCARFHLAPQLFPHVRLRVTVLHRDPASMRVGDGSVLLMCESDSQSESESDSADDAQLSRTPTLSSLC